MLSHKDVSLGSHSHLKLLKLCGTYIETNKLHDSYEVKIRGLI